MAINNRATARTPPDFIVELTQAVPNKMLTQGKEVFGIDVACYCNALSPYLYSSLSFCLGGRFFSDTDWTIMPL